MSDNSTRVLLFSGRFQLRGSCAYTLRLAENLTEEGFRAEVVCPDASRVDKCVRAQLNIRDYPHLQIPLWNRFALQMMARELSANPPQLVHIQARNALAQGARLAAQLNIPYVLTVHDYLGQHERLFIDTRICKKVITVSESVRLDFLNRTGLSGSLVTVIPGGVRCPPDDELPPFLPPGRSPVIGTAGPLEAVKGFPFFIAAAAKVLLMYPAAEFVIAGAGPEESRLRGLVRELGITEHVTFVPNIFDFGDALAAMDLFCLPSLQQGLGTIMLEAMALARPVIATRVGGVYRVIRDGETGMLVPPSDVDSLARTIADLLASPEKARAMGMAARREVQTSYGIEKMVSETAVVYRQVLQESGAFRRVG